MANGPTAPAKAGDKLGAVGDSPSLEESNFGGSAFVARIRIGIPEEGKGVVDFLVHSHEVEAELQ